MTMDNTNVINTNDDGNDNKGMRIMDSQTAEWYQSGALEQVQEAMDEGEEALIGLER